MPGEDTPTVLIADDEAAIVDGQAARLTDEYRVRRAYGGHEALEQVGEEVDVALLDRRMPDLSGDEVLDRIRSTAGSP
jgi:CheY-like chemotaxis protein